MFKGRQTNVTGTPPSSTIHLFYSNKDVDEYNEKCLNSMQTEGAISVAVDHCEGKRKEAWRTPLLESAGNLTSREAMGLPSITNLKVGAKYMMTLNVEVFDGLVNGATGILKKISYGQSSNGTKNPIAAWISFPESETKKSISSICRIKRREGKWDSDYIGTKSYKDVARKGSSGKHYLSALLD
jgi:hypothetical protein